MTHMMLASSGTSQSIEDKLYALKYFLWGQGISYVVLKSTTSELIAPKKKHLTYLITMTNEPNVSIPSMVKHLIIRARHPDWPVVFKALITMHQLTTYGNERFIQNIASSVVNSKAVESLSSFADQTSSLAHNMSKFLRRYARYLNVKVRTYRSLGIDFCRVSLQVKMKDVTLEHLLNVVPYIQNQLDTLLAFDPTLDDLCNGIINSAFAILYKDFVKLYIVYQAFIIRLLELFFLIDNVKDANELMGLYKKFLVRMDKVSDFMPVIDSVGIDKSDMPKLSRVPSTPLKLLDTHIELLEATSTRVHERSLGSIEYGTLGRARRRSKKTPVRHATIDILSPMAVLNYKKRNEELKHLDKMLGFSSDKDENTSITSHRYDLLGPPDESNLYEELEADDSSGVQATKSIIEQSIIEETNESERDLMGLDATLPTSPILSKSSQSATHRLLDKSPVLSIME